MKSKIIATLGPASNNERIIEEMVKSGVNIFRLNASHLNEEELEEYVNTINKISKNFPILLDLPGPKIRTGRHDPIKIEEGKEYTLGENADIPANWRDIAQIKEGTIVKISDGKFEFRCIGIEGKKIKLRALNSGTLIGEQSINYPGIVYRKGLTEKDKLFAKLANKYNIPILGLSFTRDGKTIEELRKISPDKIIVAKIEVEEGIRNFDEISEHADVIMIARGDLALNIRDMFSLPEIQRSLVYRAKTKRKPVIIATQMLTSMLNNPYPTRAEISDIYNAIYEGADSLMLSEETAIGNYPIRCVKAMKRIIEDFKGESISLKPSDLNDEIALSAANIAKIAGIRKVIAITRSGASAARLSIFSNNIEVLAVTNSLKSYFNLMFYRNVFPVFNTRLDTSEAKSLLKKEGMKNTIVIGGDERIPGTTTFIRIERL